MYNYYLHLQKIASIRQIQKINKVVYGKDMRILVLGSRGLRGGLQVHFCELTRFLRREGHDVFTIEVETITNSVSNSRKDQQIVRAGGRGPVDKFCKSVDWIRAVYFARSLKTDLYISTASGSGYAFLSKMMPDKQFGFFQVVNEQFEQQDGLFRRMVQGHDAVCPQSKTLGTIFREKLLYDGPLRVLPCFHQIHACGGIAKPPDNFGVIKLAYFGRLASNKGLTQFLPIFHELSQRFEVTLDIWGGGPEENEIRRFVASSIELASRVTMRGSYPEGKGYTDLLTSYHGLIAPSRASEGIPLVLLESASAGLPFFSCRVGGIGDCEENNPDIIISGIERDQLLSGIVDFVRRLREGGFNNHRLQKWFEANYSRVACENEWREMLSNPNEFFTTQ